MTEKIASLQTKLQHINIHNHWLQQEVRDEWITVKYIPTKKMIADRLTKALPRSEFRKFLQQVNLVDIASQILKREAEESKQKDLNHNLLQVYMREIDWNLLVSFVYTTSAERVC